MKKITEDHIAVKPDIFVIEEMDHGMSTLFDDNKPKDLMFKVGIAIMCYGVLRKKEILCIQIKDVTINVIINVEFPCSTKRRRKGFRFKIPEKLVPTFEKYISQISPKLDRTSRFMLNYNNRSKTRIQNMGENQIGNMAAELAQRLGKPDTKKFTAKSFRRTACTQLAAAGISVIGLCEAGNWKSLKTAREYMEYSEKSTDERVNLLEGKKPTVTNVVTPPEKRRKIVCDQQEQYEGATITITNCTIINISADNVQGVDKIISSAK